MFKTTWVILVILWASLLNISESEAQKRDVLVTRTWSGSVPDEALLKTAPPFITDTVELKRIWKSWRIEGTVPQIDFSKFLVVGVYSPGSKLELVGAKLDQKGDLEVVGMATLDVAEGFRFVLGLVSNDGVKSVNGKKLPAPSRK